MTRRSYQPHLLGLFILLTGFLFYFSFDTYIRPRTSALVPLEITTESSIQNASISTPAPILIVSALFLLAGPKDSKSDHVSWLPRFLQSITTDIYFYTTPDLEPFVRRVRGDLPITINTSFSSPFDIPPLSGMRTQYEEMHALDREKPRHSPELYALWNAKPYFVNEAVKNSVYKKYDFAFWNDAGSFRFRHVYAGWPDAARIEEIWQDGSLVSGTKKEDLLFFPMRGLPHSSFKFWNEHLGPIYNEVSEASFFGSTPQTLEWWCRVFYAYHDYYRSLGLFVGKDEALINALFLLFPSRFITVWLDDPLAPAHLELLPLINEGALGSCGGEWYYYQWWVASASERTRMREIFDWNAKWSWPWWRTRKTCRLTRVLGMQSVLERQFTAGWVAPVRSVALD